MPEDQLTISVPEVRINSHRLDDRLAELVGPAVERLRNGEDVLWDVALLPMAAGGPVPVVVPCVVLWLPTGVTPAPLCAHEPVWDPHGLDSEAAEQIVRRLLEALLGGRFDLLSSGQLAAEAQPAVQGGRTPSGLFVPGV